MKGDIHQDCQILQYDDGNMEFTKHFKKMHTVAELYKPHLVDFRSIQIENTLDIFS